MVNLFYYGNADATIKPSEVKDKALAKKLDIGNPHVLDSKGISIQSWEPNENNVALAWQKVQAA